MIAALFKLRQTPIFFLTHIFFNLVQATGAAIADIMVLKHSIYSERSAGQT